MTEIQDLGDMDSVEKLNEMNVVRLQINEHEILEKNLEYLVKMRKEV